MFTGIIKAKGRVAAMQTHAGDIRLSVVSDGLLWDDYDIGESIAVNGVCLTAVAFNSSGFDTDVSLETLNVTALGALETGAEVNLEPAVSLGERLGGHMVSGHVDCVGKVVSRVADARSIRFRVEIPPQYSRYVAKKGSVCLDGVSLTINEVSGNSFDVNIIPHTAAETIIDGYTAGTLVNVEVDLLARYLERLLQADASDDGDNISTDFLKAHGYA